ncbi:MAG: hypothetical protein LBI13_05805 [Streptococcaceae bacterium]|nr:hypothetical protein [Streptococcaceae bacterium]
MSIFSSQNVKSDSSATHQEMLSYQEKLNSLADALTKNTVDSINLENDIKSRKYLVEEQMRNTQLNQRFANSNVLYLMLFNNLSLEQALAMSKIINTSAENIAQLKKDEAKLVQAKKTIETELNQAQLTYDILNTQFKDEMASEEAAKQAQLAAQTEAAKKSLAAASDNNSIKVAVPTTNSSSSTSTNSVTSSDNNSIKVTVPTTSASTSWSGWSPAQAAQYVSNGTDVSATQWLNIIYRESSGNPTATNSATGTYGYFQMNGVVHGVDYATMTPQQYLDAVIALYKAQGAGAWSQTW